MRRCVFLLVFIIAVCAWMGVGAASASASFSCTPEMVNGGEHAPTFTNGGLSIHDTVTGGYNCTKSYTANVFSQYEFGGTWHDGVNGSGQTLEHDHGPYSCCTGHGWTEATQTPVVGSGLFLPCHYNWRYHVILYSNDGLNSQDDVSPELFSNC